MLNETDYEAPEPSKKLPISGFILTAVWLIVVSIYISRNWETFASIKPNEMGDFAAGVFAPLAFLWLVLGFFQQGDELRNSGRALWLQGRELQHSVEQQRELVNVTREQLQFDSEMLKVQRDEIARNAQPMLKLETGGSMGGSPGNRIYNFKLINQGRRCTAVEGCVGERAMLRADALESGGRAEFNLELPHGDIQPFSLVVSYLDDRLIKGGKTFNVTGSTQNFVIDESMKH